MTEEFRQHFLHETRFYAKAQRRVLWGGRITTDGSSQDSKAPIKIGNKELSSVPDESNGFDASSLSHKGTHFSGGLSTTAIRSVYWRVLLNALSPTSTTSWKTQIRCKRREYDFLCKSLNNTKDNKEDTSNINAENSGRSSKVNAKNNGDDLRHQIEIDLNRLNCDDEKGFFNSVSIKKALSRILMIWAIDNPQTGYRQGMHEVCAVLLYVVTLDSQLHEKHAAAANADDNRDKSDSENNNSDKERGELLFKEIVDKRCTEADTYSLFCQVMRVLEPLYEVKHGVCLDANGNVSDRESPILIRTRKIQFESLGKVDIELANKLRQLEVDPRIYMLRWLRLMFAFEYKMEHLIEIWDLIFASAVRMSSPKNADFPMLDHVATSMLVEDRELIIQGDHSEMLQALIRYNTSKEEKRLRIIQTALKLHSQATTEYRSISMSPRGEESKSIANSNQTDLGRHRNFAYSPEISPRQKGHNFASGDKTNRGKTWSDPPTPPISTPFGKEAIRLQRISSPELERDSNQKHSSPNTKRSAAPASIGLFGIFGGNGLPTPSKPKLSEEVKKLRTENKMLKDVVRFHPKISSRTMFSL